MSEIKECPYCGSKKIHNAYCAEFECEECERLFDEEDVEREDLRHQISCLLNGTSESEPRGIYFMIPSAKEEAYGLSTLEIPHIDKVFEVEGDGTMWYHQLGENDLESGEPIWHDLDELELSDLRALLKYLQEEM